MSPVAQSIGRRSRFVGFVLLVMLAATACGSTAGTAPPSAGSVTGQSSAPVSSGAAATLSPSPSGSPAAAATPRATAAPPTVNTFWAAVTRGLGAAKHLQVTSAGSSPGVLRYEANASAAIVDGTVAFICANGATYDGQSGFARVPGSWQCGAAALVSGFRRIGQPADSWSAKNVGDRSITESVTRGSDGTWTWTYTGTSLFPGGRVTASATLDPVSGRILAAQRTDLTGVTTYTFDYTLAFPALAVPAH